MEAVRAALYLTHLGAAGWEITDGQRVILLDPYLSRLRIAGQFGTYTTPTLPGDARRVFGPDDDLVSDTAAVDAHVSRADFVLHSHSHFNHTIDMPYIAKKTGATVIGTESTINLARAGSVPESQLLAVHGGEDWQFDGFSVKVIPSLHSALNGKHFFDSRVVPRDFRGPRRHGTDVEGGTLAYLLRLASYEILWFGSMNYIEREVAGAATRRGHDRRRPPATRDLRLHGAADARARQPADRIRHTLGRTVGPIRRAPGRAPARGRGVRAGGQGHLTAHAGDPADALRASHIAAEGACVETNQTPLTRTGVASVPVP